MSIAARLPASGSARLLVVALVAGVLAAVVNLLVFVVASAAGVPFMVQLGPGMPFQELNALPFIFSALMPALVGAGIYALLLRFTQRGATIFTGLAVVVALLSLISPLSMDVAWSTRLVLALLHLTTAAIITTLLVRLYPAQP